MKELATSENTSVRVHNFWMNGATGEVQAVLVRCKDGKPTNEYFDMPKQVLSDVQLDALQAMILEHGQYSDRVLKEQSDELIAVVRAANVKTEADFQKAQARKKTDEKSPVPQELPRGYERVLPDGPIR